MSDPVMDQILATGRESHEKRFDEWVAEEFQQVPDDLRAVLKDAHIDGATFGIEFMTAIRNPMPEVLVELRDALKEMCEEFRQYDLPYGSAAYARAIEAISRCESQMTL